MRITIGETSEVVLTLLTKLMSGFMTTWAVYGLKTYTKQPQFEWVIQAAIYRFLVNTVVAILDWTNLFAGKDRQSRPLGQIRRIGRIYGQSNYPVDRINKGCDSRKSTRCNIKKINMELGYVA